MSRCPQRPTKPTSGRKPDSSQALRVSEKPLVAEARLPGISLSGNHLVNKDKKKGWSPDMEPRPMFSYQPSPNRGLRRCHVVSSYFSEPPQAAPGW